MTTHDGTAVPETSGASEGPLSLDDLFNAEVSGASQASALSPASAPSAVSTDSPEDPADIDHDDEPDDVDTAGELGLEEADPEDPEDLDDSDDGDGDIDADTRWQREDDADVTFADLGLPSDLLKAVTDMGFVTPTAIQREAIPVLMSGRDVVGVAQTGTGKTAAFALPLLDAVDAKDASVQALVLAPTRELALQSAEAVTEMAARSRGLDVVAVYGGAPYGPQISALRSGAQVVVGTPGRVIDLIDKGALDLAYVRYFVLDEADEMLRMGFAEDVETIASSLPDERRTALFSATMPPAIQAVARQHLTDPVRVEVSRQSSTVDTVHQTYAVVPFRHKIGAVSRVLAVTEAQAAIVFVRTKSTAEDVAIELAGRGIQAAAISGDVPQRERERLVERLRGGTLDVLVATDVAARGLDVDRIGLVVNFDVPREAEAYVHRIGRTGRAGRHGEAITFLTPKEKFKLRQIERLTGTELEEVTLPSPADVSRHRAAKLLDRAAARRERGRLSMYSEMAGEKAGELGIDLDELAATLLALAVGDEGPKPREEKSGERPRQRREVEVDEEGTFVSASFEGGRDRAPRRERERRERVEGKPGASRGGHRNHEGPGTTYRVEVGHRDRVLPGAIVGAIANEAGISGSDIGRIQILQSFSLVDVYTDLSPKQLQALRHATFGGRELRMRVDEGPGGGWDGPRRRHTDSDTKNDGERGGQRGEDHREHRRERGEHGGDRAHHAGGSRDEYRRSYRESYRNSYRDSYASGRGQGRESRKERRGFESRDDGAYQGRHAGGRDGARDSHWQERGRGTRRDDRGNRGRSGSQWGEYWQERGRQDRDERGRRQGDDRGKGRPRRSW